MFVDASALVSIIVRESDAASLEQRLLTAERPLTSAVAIYEATLAIARIANGRLDAAERVVLELLTRTGTTIVPIGSDEARLALEAHARFGKGRHPAGLNMGDCFAYACARTHGATLLYKGEDFALTDAASA